MFFSRKTEPLQANQWEVCIVSDREDYSIKGRDFLWRISIIWRSRLRLNATILHLELLILQNTQKDRKIKNPLHFSSREKKATRKTKVL